MQKFRFCLFVLRATPCFECQTKCSITFCYRCRKNNFSEKQF